MPIGFPVSPTLGDQWPVVSPRWEFDGAKWVAIAGTSGTATPVTDRLASIVGTDDFIGLRAGAPYLVAASVIADYTGGAPADTAPAAFTAGQWTADATGTAGQISFNLTALPADGGSAITALEYRVGAGAAIAFVGTGTGVRVVVAGLTAGVAVDLQVRAVNAVGAGAWSDIKNRTPAASGGSGTAVWEAMATTTGGSMNPGAGVVLTKPAGTVATDLLVAIRRVVNPATLTDMVVPAGWTLRGAAHAVDFGDSGFAMWTAAGDVADGTWVQSTAFATGTVFDVHRISGVNLAAPVRDYAESETPAWGPAANMPSPSVTVSAGDCVLAYYWQPQNSTAVGAPVAGYTRALDAVESGGRASTLYRSNAPAGATGSITHGAAAAFEGRATATLALAAA